MSIKYETYVGSVRMHYFQDALNRFRLGITDLRTHKHRYISRVQITVVHFVKWLKKARIIFYFIEESMKLLDRRKKNVTMKTGHLERLCCVKIQHRPNS